MLAPLGGLALRASLAVAIASATSTAPALAPSVALGSPGFQLVSALLRGSVVALMIALPLAVARQVGATTDRLVGAGVADQRGPLALVAAALGAIAWLRSGAVAAASRLLVVGSSSVGAASLVATVVHTLTIAVALSTVVLFVAIFVEVAVGFASRGAGHELGRAIGVVARPVAIVLALSTSLELVVASGVR
jgi:hypothetical protein